MHDRALAYLAEEAKNGSLVIFVGSGVSRNAGLPSWDELINPLLKKLGVKSSGDPLDNAQWYVDAHGRPALLQHVQQALAVGQSPSGMHTALARIQAPVYMTTNYDHLIEGALQNVQGVPPDVVIDDGQVALIDEARRTTVVKLHGCLSLPETIVLTRDDYDIYADSHRAMIAYMQSLLATRTFLFAGVSLTDPNFRAIHQVIRRALGDYNRKAYLLDGKEWPEPVVRYWSQRGVRILEFTGTDVVDGIAQETAFIGEIAARSQRDSCALDAARSLQDSRPPVAAERLIEKIEALPAELAGVLEQARDGGLLRVDRSAFGDVAPEGSAGGPEGGHWLRIKARKLLDLALAVDALVPVADDGLWIELGDSLYGQRDSVGAIRAYNVVLRPRGQNQSPDGATVRRVYGNLARAHMREGHLTRAEWLLRRCVFLPGMELPDNEPSSSAVFDRLDQDHLRARPTDASEFAFVVSRRAEHLISGRHYAEAFEALREARHVLGPIIGEAPKPKFRLDFFNHERESQGRGWGQYQRAGTNHTRRSNPKAYALNFLGKCYRLSWKTASVLGLDDPGYYRDLADDSLRKASVSDPYLPYPYGHRFSLASDPRVSAARRKTLLRELADDLVSLASGVDGRLVVASFLYHLPPAATSEPKEVAVFRGRLADLGITPALAT